MAPLLLSAALLLGAAALAAADPPAAPAAPAPAIRHLGGPRHELNGISFNDASRAISLPAKINLATGLLEYALVHESGKAHESLLTTPVSPFDLNIVLLLLNYRPSTTFFDQSNKEAGAVLVPNPKIDPASNLLVTLDWKDPSGTPRSARLESLLLNLDRKAPAADGPFTYTGSMLMEDGTFMAKETGSILALYADAAALLNNPRPGNQHDDIWAPNPAAIPPKGTALTLTFPPAP